MNYQPVKYFFSSACGNCSLAWQQDQVQISPWGWLVGKCPVGGSRGCATEPITIPWPRTRMWWQRMGGTCGCAWHQIRVGASCQSRWARIASAGSRGEGSGRVRQGKAFLALLLLRCTGRAVPNNTCTAGISSYSASVSQKPFLWSQWHLINIKLMWIKGNWDIYISIPFYHWVWFYFCSHWFDTDTAPLAFTTWICV